MDLLGYVEYQRKQKMVIRLHREALQAMCNFWRALDTSTISFTNLSKALGKIEKSVSQAQAAYRVVLESYGNNPKLVRLYGRFLQTIKNDPWGASKYYAEAERLEELKNGDASGPLLPDGTPLGRMDEMSVGVLVLTVTGEIQVANRQTHVMFGIKRGNLEGKHVMALLAPHCSRWIMNKLKEMMNESGMAAAVRPDTGSQEAVLVGMHSDRIALPVKVSLSRVSGVGEDSTFIALLEPLELERDVASLWVSHNGSIAACDPHFVSFFGWTAHEVNSAILSAFVSVPSSTRSSNGGDLESGALVRRRRNKGVSDLISRLLAGALVDDGASDSRVEQGVPCLVFHKYDSTPVTCVLSISQADATDLPVYELRVRLATSAPPQLLVVSRKGHFIHAASALVASLRDAAGGRGKYQQMGALPGPQAAARVPGDAGPGGEAGVGAEGALMRTDLLAGYTLSDFLPQPWREMHVKYLKDTATMGTPSRVPFSCRDGASPGPTLELRSASGKPLYMHVSVSTTDVGGELTHVIRMARSSLDEALSERRLRLSVADDGLITGIVSGAPSQLFGLEAGKIVGRGLWDLVDNLGGSNQAGWSSPGPHAFRAFVNRSLAFPGSSWRVRITMSPRSRAVMPAEGVPPSRAPVTKMAVIQVVPESHSEDSAMDETSEVLVDLWPVANISGVLQLDGSGRVAAILQEPMRPAGLLFGLPGQSLLGTSLSELVTLPPGRNRPGELLSANADKKSSLKTDKKEVHAKVGPVHVLQGLHSDGRPLALEVQVVGRPGANQPITAILRPHKAPMMPGAKGRPPATAAGPPRTAAAAEWPEKHELPRADPLRRTQSGLSPRAATARAPSPLRQSSRQLGGPDPLLSPAQVSLRRITLGTAYESPPAPQLAAAASMRHTGYSNAHTDSENPQMIGTMPSGLKDLPGSGSANNQPAVGAAVSGAGPMLLTGQSSFNRLLDAVEEGREILPVGELLHPLSRQGTGLGGSTPTDPQPLGSPPVGAEPTLPGAPVRMLRAPEALPQRLSRSSSNRVAPLPIEPPSDAESDTVEVPHRGSNGSEAADRIATWVTSKGTFYQNSAQPLTGKVDGYDGTGSRRTPDPEAGQGAFLRPFSPSRAAPAMPGVPGGAQKSPTRAGPAAGEAVAADAEDDAASEGGHSAISALSANSVGGPEYKRGKRFRKLAKMMDSSVAQQATHRCRRHAVGVVAILALVHVAFFSLVIHAIVTQRRSMMHLAQSDESQRYMHRIMTDVRSLDVISRNKTVSNLYASGDTEFFLNRILADTEEMKVLLNEMLYGHHASGSAVMDVLFYTDVMVWDRRADDGSDLYKNVTVWDFGTIFYNKAKDIVQEYYDLQANGTAIADTRAGVFILKSGPDLWRASRKALDALLYIAVDDVAWVDDLQLIFLAIEGAFLTCLAAGYVAYLLRAVAAQRYKLYNTFLVIPVGLTRALASQSTALLVDEEDEDDFDDDVPVVAPAASNEQETEQGDDAAKAKRRTTIRVSESGALPSGLGSPEHSTTAPRRANSHLGPSSVTGKLGPSRFLSESKDKDKKPRRAPAWVLSVFGCGLFRRLGAQLRRASSSRRRPSGLGLPASAPGSGGAVIAGGSSKRNLRYDSHETAMMVTPFVVWAMLVIAFYATAVVHMREMDSVVAIHAVSNFMAARIYRTIFFGQELSVVEDPAQLPAKRAALVACKKIIADAFYTLELGKDAYKVAGPNTEQFPMVNEGIAFASGSLQEIFYGSGKCHRSVENLPCPGPEYRYYQTIYTGFDSMMQGFMERVASLADSNSTIPPGLANEDFDFIYNVGSVDLLDATIEAEDDHYKSINGLFTGILWLHISLFLLMWVVIAVFLFLLLNPVLKRITRERRHIAELMSQLPLELDVEKLVARALGTAPGTIAPGGQAAPGPSQPNGSMKEPAVGGTMDGYDIDNGVVTGADTTKWKAVIRSASNMVNKQNSGSLITRRVSASM